MQVKNKLLTDLFKTATDAVGVVMGSESSIKDTAQVEVKKIITKVAKEMKLVTSKDIESVRKDIKTLKAQNASLVKKLNEVEKTLNSSPKNALEQKLEEVKKTLSKSSAGTKAKLAKK